MVQQQRLMLTYEEKEDKEELGRRQVLEVLLGQAEVIGRFKKKQHKNYVFY